MPGLVTVQKGHSAHVRGAGTGTRGCGPGGQQGALCDVLSAGL